MKKLLYFGIYDPKYARTRVIQNGFVRNGWSLSECRVDPRVHKGLSKYLHLFWLGMQMRKEKYDLVIVGYPGQTVVWLARLLFGPRIVFDAFLSLFDSNVFDRKVYAEDSWRSRKDKFLDTSSCSLARKVLLDTEQHIEYFVSTFGLPHSKFERIWISADDSVFFPVETSLPAQFTVHFHGTFIPLQGISYIVKAADILRNENIHFRLVGGGQEFEMIKKMVSDLKLEDVVEFTGKVPVNEVPALMANAHVVLGIFGDTNKTKRVIPNKVYEAMAMGKVIITADTPAIAELPGAQEALSLVPVADARALASAIVDLRNNDERRVSLGNAAYALYEKELRPEHMVKELVRKLV